MTPSEMHQSAPFPLALEEIVEGMSYKPGWTFELKSIDRGQGSIGLTLDIVTLGYNSYHHEQGQNYRVHHYMIVPAASYRYEDWRRWVLDQIILVETHEACEFFEVNGAKPYAPRHGPGCNPYVVVEYGTDEERRTSFRGVVKPS